jgi:hypothetical protein
VTLHLSCACLPQVDAQLYDPESGRGDQHRASEHIVLPDPPGFGLPATPLLDTIAALAMVAAHQHHRGVELSVTPVGPLDLAAVEHYAELGIDRLVLLPQPDADRAQRHAPVPAGQILRNIDTVADQIIAKL